MADAKTIILTAARNCIAAAGVRGLRVNDVAAEAGVSPGLLYYHFTDRAGLLAATLDFIDTGARAFGQQNAGADALELLLGELQDDSEVRQNSVAWNELRSVAVFEKELSVSLAETTATWNSYIAESLTAGFRTAESATAETTTADDGRSVGHREDSAEILTSLVEGLSSRWLSGSMSVARAQQLVRIALDALAQAAPPPSTRETP